jgi:predicted lysophospholipase L1 biosynthesis ABC-type transport system permease subunit
MKNGQALLSQTGSLRIGPVGGATVPLTTLGPGDAFPLRDTTRDDQDGHKTVILDLPDHLQIASEIEDQPWFVAGAFSGVPTVRLIVSQGYASRHFAVLPSFDQGIAWQLLLDAQPGQEKALQIMLAGQLTGREGEALSLEDNYANLQMARDLVFVMDVFLYGFTVVIILICAMNIINIVTTQIVLRRRELAMLRAIGMSGTQQTVMLLAESALYGLTGALWGSAAGLLLLAALTRQTDQLLAGSGLQGVPWPLVLWTLAGALVLSLLAGILPIRRVRRASIVDAIREDG